MKWVWFGMVNFGVVLKIFVTIVDGGGFGYGCVNDVWRVTWCRNEVEASV